MICVRADITMSNHDKRYKQHINDNTVIIDWILAIYGAYIGIWLGLFVQQIWQNKSKVIKVFLQQVYNQSISTTIIVGFPILFLIFT